MRIAWFAALCILLAACGSGSKSPAGTDGKVLVPDTTTGTARVEISTEGPTAQTVLYAAEFTLRLPAGVTVPTADGLVAPGVLVPALAGSFAGAGYSAATAGAEASIHVNIANTGGFTVGPLATITCAVAPGTEVAPAAFTVEGFSARDANGAPLPGVIPRLTVVMQ